MVNDADKSKLMAYVHGELSGSEAMDIAKQIEADPDLRSEIDAIGRASRQISEHFTLAKREEEDFGLSPDQVLKIRATAGQRTKSAKSWSWSWLLGSGALVAAGVAAVVFFTGTPQQGPFGRMDAATNRVAAVPQAAVPQPAMPLAANAPTAQHIGGAGGGGSAGETSMADSRQMAEPAAPPPADSVQDAHLKNANMDVLQKEMEVQRAEKTTAAPEGSFGEMNQAKKALAAAAPPPPASYAMKARAKSPVKTPNEDAPAAQPEDQATASAANADTEVAIIRSFHLVSGGLTVTKGLNRAKIASYITKRLEKNQSCVPDASDAKPGTEIRVQMKVTSKGKIQSLDTTPKLPDLIACLKTRLSTKPDILKPKSGTTKQSASFRLKVQAQ